MSGALLLDLDGVLFDSEPVHQQAWERALADLGVALPHGWYEALAGRSLLEVASAISLRHAPGRPPAELAARKRAAYQVLAAGLPPVPGVLEALAESGSAPPWSPPPGATTCRCCCAAPACRPTSRPW